MGEFLSLLDELLASVFAFASAPRLFEGLRNGFCLGTRVFCCPNAMELLNTSAATAHTNHGNDLRIMSFLLLSFNSIHNRPGDSAERSHLAESHNCFCHGVVNRL